MVCSTGLCSNTGLAVRNALPLTYPRKGEEDGKVVQQTCTPFGLRSSNGGKEMVMLGGNLKKMVCGN